jgi:hypothetical protein
MVQTRRRKLQSGFRTQLLPIHSSNSNLRGSCSDLEAQDPPPKGKLTFGETRLVSWYTTNLENLC